MPSVAMVMIFLRAALWYFLAPLTDIGKDKCSSQGIAKFIQQKSCVAFDLFFPRKNALATLLKKACVILYGMLYAL
eukprot:5834389-Amphidinium_carterae.1